MNRAERAAMEAIPKRDSAHVFTYFGVFDIDYDAEKRKYFEKGYTKGEKDTIERVKDIVCKLNNQLAWYKNKMDISAESAYRFIMEEIRKMEED